MGDQANLLQSLGWAVLNSLWQFAFLWVVFKGISSLTRTARPAAKSLLATVLLFTGFAWFIYTFINAYLSGHAQNSLTGLMLSADSSNNVSLWLQQSLPVASALYLVLLIFPVLRFIRNYRYVQVIRRYGLSKLPADWRLFVQNTAHRMGIKMKVTAWLSEYVSSPVTIGFWKPVILVPIAAMNHLTPAQLEAVLLHELSHIRRFDYLVNLFMNMVQTILYFNPFVKDFVKTVERERENSCDELVLQFQYDSHEYASALLLLEKSNQSQQRFVIAASGKRNDFLHRIERIMGVQKKPAITFNKIAGLMAGILCFIGLNALLILAKPVMQNGYSSLAEMNSPAEMFTEPSDETADKEIITAEHPLETIAHVLTKNKVTNDEGNEAPPSPDEIVPEPVSVSINPAFIQAGLDIATQQVKMLSKAQEKQIKEAVAASKRVLEEAEWKKVESEIADVFSAKEKENLKQVYEKSLNKFDWKLWESKLRQTFDQVDWERVNEQLTNAVSMIRIDSLQRVYSEAIAKLDEARNQMIENNESGIPDTDITLKEVEHKKRQLIRLNSFLKGIRTKKIVRL